MLGVMIQSSLAAEVGRLAEVEQAGLRCALIAQEADGALNLSGEIAARSAHSGDYVFTVRKLSQSGSANVRQGGTFSTAAGATVAAGAFATNRQPDTTYRLDLVVTIGGEERCRVSYDGPVSTGRED